MTPRMLYIRFLHCRLFRMMFKVCRFVVMITALIVSDASFICRDGNEIDRNLLCDGAKDCMDGTDEMRQICLNSMCPSNQFRCCYGACVTKNARCNGTEECADGSDEYGCKGNQKFRPTELNCHDLTESCPKNAFRCRIGGCVRNDVLCDKVFDCVDGSDESDMLCRKGTSRLKCPPVPSEGLISFCESEEGAIPCNAPVSSNTVAQMECRPFYEVVDDEESRNIYCQPDGRWNGAFLNCKPECGIRDDGVQSLIVNGWSEEKPWPWHAVLYSFERSEWQFSCGGSLISKYVVLTAAHCVWKKSSINLRLALGKYQAEYKLRKKGVTQFRNVSQIIMQPLYHDFQSNYGSDIAVLFLEKPVEFSQYVRPVCLDLGRSNFMKQLSNYTLGRVVGMGITENDTFSETLLSTYLPVVPQDVCLRSQRGSFRKYVTFTTYCAGYRNGTGVCNGDSGGGMMFKDASDRWFLQGIVSISPRKKGIALCDTKRYTIFTKVALYLDWLQEVLSPKQLGQ